MTQLRDETIEISGHMTIVDTVQGRIHVPSGSVLDLAGVALDGVVVTGGGYACISGTTTSLTVTVGARAVLTGTCLGPVVNDGGDVTIHGVVQGPIVEHAGQAVIGHTASVRAAGRPEA